MLNDNSTIKSNKSREEKKEQNEKANDYIELWAIENDACCNGKSHMHSYEKLLRVLQINGTRKAIKLRDNIFFFCSIRFFHLQHI